jgi:hypothetical protein
MEATTAMEATAATSARRGVGWNGDQHDGGCGDAGHQHLSQHVFISGNTRALGNSVPQYADPVITLLRSGHGGLWQHCGSEACAASQHYV